MDCRPNHDAAISSQKPRRKRRGRFDISKNDFIGKHTEKTYAVVIDPSGKLNWDVNYVDTEHVIEVLTEKVTKNISIIYVHARCLIFLRVNT